MQQGKHYSLLLLSTLPAGCALSATLVLVEHRQPSDRLHHIGLLVHNDDSSGAEAGLGRNQRVEIHHHVVANLRLRDDSEKLYRTND